MDNLLDTGLIYSMVIGVVVILFRIIILLGILFIL